MFKYESDSNYSISMVSMNYTSHFLIHFLVRKELIYKTSRISLTSKKLAPFGVTEVVREVSLGNETIVDTPRPWL